MLKNNTIHTGRQMSFLEEGQAKFTKLSGHEQRLYEFLLNGGQYSNKELMKRTPDRDPRSTIRYLRNKGVQISDKWVKANNSRFKIYFIK